MDGPSFVEDFMYSQNFRRGPSAFALIMNTLFEEEMAREAEELCRTHTVSIAADCQDSFRSLDRAVGESGVRQQEKDAASLDKRILKHKLVVLVLVLIIIFEMFLFVWRDYQWHERDRARSSNIRQAGPADGSFP